MRIVVIGATGQLGRAIVDALLAGGHGVVGVSRRGGHGFQHPSYAEARLDVTRAAPADLARILDGADAVVQAVGADDRERPPRPARRFFETELVAPTRLIADSVTIARVPRLVVLGSYFSTVARAHPEWGLVARHPYVDAREAQWREAVRLAPEAAVTVLEIPFVFGTVEGRAPLWCDTYLAPLRRGPVAVTLPGGTSATTAEDVALAAVAAATGASPAGRHPVCTDNVSHRQLAHWALAEWDRRVPLLTLPHGILTASLLAEKARLRLSGKESGLEPVGLARLLSEDLHLDPLASARTFGTTPRSVEDSARETFRAARA